MGAPARTPAVWGQDKAPRWVWRELPARAHAVGRSAQKVPLCSLTRDKPPAVGSCSLTRTTFPWGWWQRPHGTDVQSDGSFSVVFVCFQVCIPIPSCPAPTRPGPAAPASAPCFCPWRGPPPGAGATSWAVGCAGRQAPRAAFRASEHPEGQFSCRTRPDMAPLGPPGPVLLPQMNLLSVHMS